VNAWVNYSLYYIPPGPCAPVGPLSPVAPVGPCGPTGPAGPLAPWSPVGPEKKYIIIVCCIIAQPPLFIAVSVPSQESERSYICVIRMSISFVGILMQLAM